MGVENPGGTFIGPGRDFLRVDDILGRCGAAAVGAFGGGRTTAEEAGGGGEKVGAGEIDVEERGAGETDVEEAGEANDVTEAM